jgi:hypothetical protein
MSSSGSFTEFNKQLLVEYDGIVYVLNNSEWYVANELILNAPNGSYGIIGSHNYRQTEFYSSLRFKNKYTILTAGNVNEQVRNEEESYEHTRDSLAAYQSVSLRVEEHLYKRFTTVKYTDQVETQTFIKVAFSTVNSR